MPKKLLLILLSTSLALASACGGAGAPGRALKPTSSGSPSVKTSEVGTPMLPPAPPATPLHPSTGPIATVYSGKLHISQRVVFLTIDDGYVIDDRVASLLERAHVPFSLFLIARLAHDPKHLAFFRRLVKAGGTIQDHTVDHTKLAGLPESVQTSKICGPLDDYQSLFGQRPTLFRPPFGSYDSTTKRVVRSCGLNAMMIWSAIMKDGYIAEQDHNLGPGEVILLHFRTDLYVNLRNILAELRWRKLTVAKLEDYIR